MKRSFQVQAVWDADAAVFYAKSDIEGLHIEAESVEEFKDILLDVAPDLIMANHRDVSDLQNRSIADLIPTILCEPPPQMTKAAI